MRHFIPAFVIGPLILAGVLPAVGQTQHRSAVFRLAAISEPAERQTFTEKARAEMSVWEKKLHDLGDRTNANASDVRSEAKSDLDKAWAEIKSASSRLEVATVDDWESAKTSFNNASDKLSVAWDKMDIGKR